MLSAGSSDSLVFVGRSESLRERQHRVRCDIFKAMMDTLSDVHSRP